MPQQQYQRLTSASTADVPACSALLAAFPSDHYHTRSKVVTVDESHPDFVVIELENNERIAGHMLVAADG